VLFRSEIITRIPHLYCLKCGKQIKKGSKVKVLHFFSNKENYVYLHLDCEEIEAGIKNAGAGL